MAEEKITSTLRLRMSAKDAHYGGELVDGAHMVHLFGDVATELLIKLDGDEGLFCAYDNVEFLAPTYAGDYIEAYGEIDRIGNTSRHMVFEARKVKEQVYFDTSLRVKKSINYDDFIEDDDLEDERFKLAFQPGELNSLLMEKGSKTARNACSFTIF